MNVSLRTVAMLTIATASTFGTARANDSSTSIALAVAAETPLEVAQVVAREKFNKCQYGDHDKDAARVNCVQFMSAIVSDLAARAGIKDAVTPELKSRIAIDEIDYAAEAKTLKIQETDARRRRLLVIDALVETNDPRTAGVQFALTAAKLGTVVDLKDAKAGDFVQYWYKEDGHWEGHSALLESVSSGRVTLYGAHQTTLASESGVSKKDRKGGIGTSVPILLDSPTKKVYLVRWKPI